MARITPIHFNRLQLARIMLKHLPDYKPIGWIPVILYALYYAMFGHGVTIKPVFK